MPITKRIDILIEQFNILQIEQEELQTKINDVLDQIQKELEQNNNQ